MYIYQLTIIFLNVQLDISFSKYYRTALRAEWRLTIMAIAYTPNTT